MENTHEFKQRFAELERKNLKREKKIWTSKALKELLENVAIVNIRYAEELVNILYLASSSNKIGAILTDILISTVQEEKCWNVSVGLEVEKALNYAGGYNLTEIRKVDMEDLERQEVFSKDSILIFDFEELTPILIAQIEELHREGYLFVVLANVRIKSELNEKIEGLELKSTIREIQTDLLIGYGLRISKIFGLTHIKRYEMQNLMNEWKRVKRDRIPNHRDVEKLLRLKLMTQIESRECKLFDIEERKGSDNQKTADNRNENLVSNSNSINDSAECEEALQNKHREKSVFSVRKIMINLKNWFFE